MDKIVLDGIRVQNERIEYDYHVTGDLLRFFRPQVPWRLEYALNGEPLDLSTVPAGVLAVPFVCNVLPLVWLADAELVCEELDADFYRSIPQFKQGYIDMYPAAAFGGGVYRCQADNEYAP